MIRQIYTNRKGPIKAFHTGSKEMIKRKQICVLKNYKKKVQRKYDRVFGPISSSRALSFGQGFFALRAKQRKESLT